MFKIINENIVQNVDTAEFFPVQHPTYQAWLEKGNSPEPIDPPTQGEYTAAVQARLDQVASSKGYDGVLSACSYAASTNTKFKAEGKAFMAWRDAVWTQCYETLAAVEGGAATPTISELVAGLPEISI